MAEHYTCRVTWSEQDEEFVATVAEFASLSWLEEARTAALHGLEQLVAQVVQDMPLEPRAVDAVAPEAGPLLRSMP